MKLAKRFLGTPFSSLSRKRTVCRKWTTTFPSSLAGLLTWNTKSASWFTKSSTSESRVSALHIFIYINQMKISVFYCTLHSVYGGHENSETPSVYIMQIKNAWFLIIAEGTRVGSDKAVASSVPLADAAQGRVTRSMAQRNSVQWVAFRVTSCAFCESVVRNFMF